VAPERLEIYVTPLVADRPDTWLVCTESLSRCIAICSSREDAVSQALVTARYHAGRGEDVNVRIWDIDNACWQEAPFDPRSNA